MPMKGRQGWCKLSFLQILLREFVKILNSIIDRFEQIAHANPQCVALRYEDQSLSYGELNQAANVIATQLLQRGVGPEQFVAIFTERSLELPVAILATLKTGAAFLPIEPDNPIERSALVMSEAQVGVVLSTQHLQARLPASAPTCIAIDAIASARSVRVPDPKRNGSAADAAYCIYTSGTTGRPKGVVNIGAGLINRISWMQEQFPISTSDRVLQKTPIGFDVSVWELLWPLTSGAELVIAKPNGHKDPYYLAKLVRDRHISVMHFVPSMLKAWLNAGIKGPFDTLRYVFCSGEALSGDVVESFFQQFTAELHNLYGPTEASIEVTHFDCRNARTGQLIPIGKPIANIDILLLDEADHPVPEHAIGEIYIAGIGLARGYLKQAALTEAAFRQINLASGQTVRAYKTGDFGRKLENGDIEYLGRRDAQVKIRGVRVELDDIAVALRRLTGVRDAAVAVDEDDPTRLLGYVVLDAGANVDKYRQQLKTMLADTMIPACLIPVGAMPLTSNGKLDRRELQQRYSNTSRTNAILQANVDATDDILVDKVVCHISDVLGGIVVPPDGDFFNLGGDSYAAIRLVAALRATTGRDIPVSIVFESPNAQGIAQAIQACPPVPLTDVAPAHPALLKLPLSVGQGHMVHFEQIYPDYRGHTIAFALNWDGPLVLHELQRAAKLLQLKHPVLTARLDGDNDRACFVYDDTIAIDVTREPMSDPDPALLHEALKHRTIQGLTSGSGPLMRLCLFEYPASPAVVHVMVHHLVIDGASISILMQDLVDALRQPGADEQAASIIASGAVAAYREAYTDAHHHHSLAEAETTWWRERLHCAAGLDYPLDGARQPFGHFACDYSQSTLCPQSAARYRQAARAQHVTLYEFTLAALAIVLARWCQQSTVCVGSVLSMRDTAVADRTLGFRAAVVPLQISTAPLDTWQTVLRKVRAAVGEAHQHKRGAAHAIDLMRQQAGSAAAIFPIRFGLVEATTTVIGNPTVCLAELPVPQLECDLNFQVRTAPHDVTLFVDSKANLFNQSTIDWLLAQWRNALDAIAIDSAALAIAASLSPLPALPPTCDKSLFDAFTAVVRERGEGHAIEFDGIACSYNDLHARADSIAAAIAAQRSGQAPVALLCNNPTHAIAAMLGALKNGNPFVALNPSDPPARMRQILGSCGARVLIADDAAATAATNDGNCSLLLYQDAVSQVWPDYDAVPAKADSVAYVLYTSGSTGQPKGVVQNHRNVLHHALTFIDSIKIDRDDHISLFASLAYDAAMMDVFGTLLSGATLYPWPLSTRGLDGIGAWISAAQITVLHSTPAVFRAICASVSEQAVSSVRIVLLGGEVARGSDLDCYRRLFRPCATLVNGYGPSESTLALQAFFTHASVCEHGSLPIGRPVAGTTIALVGPDGNYDALRGEIEIVSPYVKLGYLSSAPDLDACRELAHAVRTHRSGDLARRLPDGTLLHLGRLDKQIKISGIRIEPAEIEAAIEAMEAVRAVAVVSRPWPRQRLLAYVVATEGSSLTAEMVDGHLRQLLPDAMIPSHIVFVPDLPYLANGKVDLHALPEPEAALVVPPRALTRKEQYVAGIWSDVLAINTALTPFDRFMHLGGTSLEALRVIATVQADLGIRCLPSTLLNNVTLEQFALKLVPAASPAPAACSQVAPTTRHSLSPQQRRFWYLHQAYGEQDRNVVLTALRAPAGFDRATLERALNQVAQRHALLSAKFREEAGEPILLTEGTVAPQVAWLECDTIPSPVTLDALPATARAPFDLAHGTPLRAYVIQAADGSATLALLFHHIVVDEWSVQVIINELILAYTNALAGIPCLTLDVANPSFMAANERLTDLLNQTRSTDIDFWCAELATCPLLLDLPIEGSRPGDPSFEAERRSVRLPVTLTQALRGLCAQQAVSPSATFLAVFALILGKYARQQEVVVGMPVSLRALPAEQSVVGPLLNSVAVRCQLTSWQDFWQFAQGVFGQMARALDHAMLPFDQVVEAVRPVRDGNRHPIYQAGYSYHRLASPMASGTALHPVDSFSGVITCDIAFTVEDDGAGNVELFLDTMSGVVHPRLLERMLEQIGWLLATVTETPAQAFATIDVVPAAQRADLVDRLNRSLPLLHRHNNIVEHLCDWARTNPDAVALSGEASLSYAQLAGRAHALAIELTAHGIMPGDFVPVAVADAQDCVIAELALMMTGAAFVPTDFGASSALLAQLMHDINAKLILGAASADFGLPVLAVPSAASPSTPPPSPVEPDGAMYAMCTSGSTGGPKVVSVANRGILNRFSWMSSFYSGDAPVSLQTTSLLYDSSIWQVFWPLVCGGRSVIPDRAALFDADAFSSLIERERVTVVDFVPSVLYMLLPEFENNPQFQKRLQHLQWIILGAEVLPADLAERVRKLVPGARLTNLYGPTEASIGCIFHEIVSTPSHRVPIGRPLPNVNAVVLDQHGGLAPRGALGELCVIGPCVGLGYLAADQGGFHRAEIVEFAGQSAFRTGDIVRWNEQGHLDFYGRADKQIKVRGVRIEPEAIEQILGRHQAVRRAVVTVQKNPYLQDLDQLTALVELDKPASADTAELFTWMHAHLPPAQCPDVIQIVEAFPLTNAGKLDLRSTVTVASAPVKVAGTQTQAKLLEIWARLLPQSQRLSLDVNFFDAGGHSLMLLALRREIESEFGITLRIVDLFRHSTARAQAACVAVSLQPA
ncbi:MAG: hypothetical protein NVSMB6_01110 [Burkholderiaceae bacterium]